MSEKKTIDMLQRVPVILAVTASSYGLRLQAGRTGRAQAAGAHRRSERSKAGEKPAAQR